MVGAATRDLVGKPHAHLEIERVAHLRSIDPEDDDVLCRVFNEQGIRSGHGNQSKRFGSCDFRKPTAGYLDARVDDSKRIDDTCSDFIARAGNAMSRAGSGYCALAPE